MTAKTIAIIVISFLSFSAKATVVQVNEFIHDFGEFSRDLATGLDWLDFDGGGLPSTIGRSFNEIYPELGPGGDYDGWRLASRKEVNEFIFHVSGVAHNGNAKSSEYIGVTDKIANLTGYTRESLFTRHILGRTSDTFPSFPNIHYAPHMFDFLPEFSQGYGFWQWEIGGFEDSVATAESGSWLVRNSTIPIPASTYLFGSALLGWVVSRSISQQRKLGQSKIGLIGQN